MALLFISEFSEVLEMSNGPIQIARQPSLVDQTPVVVGAGSLQSAAFNRATRFVRLETDVICSISFGTNPTASATTARMAANQTEYFCVNPGDKVAVITNS